MRHMPAIGNTASVNGSKPDFHVHRASETTRKTALTLDASQPSLLLGVSVVAAVVALEQVLARIRPRLDISGTQRCTMVAEAEPSAQEGL